MADSRVTNIPNLLVRLAIAYFVVALFFIILDLRQLEGLLLTPEHPLGGDFINLLATGKLIVAGQIDKIYVPAEFRAFERLIIDADIGSRLWAYPPHSLLFSWPFAGLNFIPGLFLWSALGIGVLVFAARRYGFQWWEVLILCLSPASIKCVSVGQSGNLATGLLLLALAARGSRDRLSVVSAVLLTIKPQFGFLLPVLWLVRGNWFLIAATGIGMFALIGLSVAIFGADVWMQYINETVPVLGALEKHGSGPFMAMIPSVFMSARIFSIDGETALAIHWVFAAIIGVWFIQRMIAIKDHARQDIVLLIATCLMTPYLHFYDLNLLVCAGLLMIRQLDKKPVMVQRAIYALAAFAWLLPGIIHLFYALKIPVSPLGILALFMLA